MANVQRFWNEETSTWDDNSVENVKEIDELFEEVSEINHSNRTANSVAHNPDCMVDSLATRTVNDKVASFTNNSLYSRDREYIKYTKSLLEHGDTLVFIKYPGDIDVYDPTGSHLKPQTHRVHSDKLLATGSDKFTKLLSDDWKQHLMRKRNGFPNKEALPSGITYVLDLTPPDEGDEAVDLISNLSCSPGIRNWYSSTKRCGVHKNLVGGKDDISMSKNCPTTLQGSNTATIPGLTDTFATVHDNRADDEKMDMSLTPEARWPSIDLNEENLRKALHLSREEDRLRQASNFQYDLNARDTHPRKEEVDEYCPLRHCAGIQALLQVIEGKDPKLDSAPKVWTLVGVAKHFECTNLVIDFVLSWMLTEPNTRFFETLPEASFTIGKTLQNSIITRPAFAILVSEEALSLASRMNKESDSNCGMPSRRQARDKSNSRLGRPMEDIDEDSLTAIQAAATDFQSRIQKAVNDLLDPDMKWFNNLPEFAKLISLESDESINVESKESIRELVSCLRHYVRAELLSIFSKPLSNDLNVTGNAHRKAEHYYPGLVKDMWNDLYDNMTDGEMIMTKFYWTMLHRLAWNITINIPYLFDLSDGTRYVRNRAVIDYYMVSQVTMNRIFGWQNRLHDLIRASGFKVGNEDNTGLPISGLQPPHPLDIAQQKPDQEKSLHASHNAYGSSVQIRYNYDRSRLNPFSEASKQFDWNKDFEEFLATKRQEMNASVASSTTQKLKFETPSHETKKTSNPESPILGSIADWELPIRPRPVRAQEKPEPVTEALDPYAAVALHNSDKSERCYGAQLSPGDTPGSSSKPQLPHIAYSPPLHSANTKKDDPYSPSTLVEVTANVEYPFFSVRQFMVEVSCHVKTLAQNMLSNSDVEFRDLTDTLLCLTDKEYKYLPLWAGGDDDGTGGVYDPSLPPASMGPIGPGPSYHTGFSVNSRASTEMDWEGSSADTSIAVENGFSDHIDRRVVQSDDGFESSITASLTFSYDSEDYDDVKDKGKRKAVEKGVDLNGQGKAVERDVNDDDDMTDKNEDMTDENDDFESFSDDESWVDDDGQI